MANYIPQLDQQKSQYSLIDLPEFQTAYSGMNSDEAIQAPTQEPYFSKDVARASAQGAQAGGLSGALTSGGITSLLTSGASTGNVAAIGGGLILSQIEAAQKAKQAAEEQRVANEKARMAKTQAAYAGMANQRFGV